MKLFKLTALLIACSFIHYSASSQNILLNILTQNTGVVRKGETVLLEITVCNTDPADSVPMYKLRPQVSVPAEIAEITAAGHNLPAGWTISSNNRSTIRLSNGTDKLPANQCRTILIALKGKVAGGPSTISANMLFSNGEAPGSAAGGPTTGDNPADNISTSTIKVIN